MTMRQANAIKPTANTNETRSDNVGTSITLLGSRPDETGALVRVDDDSATNVPWLFSVSAKITNENASAVIPPVAKGFFGPGGAAQQFECDVSPDSILTLPGTTAKVTVGWDKFWVFTTNVVGGSPDTIQKVRSIGGTNLLPTSTTIIGGVKHGSPVVPNATRSIRFTAVTGPAHVCVFPCPAFSNNLVVYCGLDATYANITHLAFRETDVAGGGDMVRYTGAQLLAFKNSGIPIPVPGGATTAVLILAANLGGVMSFGLNL